MGGKQKKVSKNSTTASRATQKVTIKLVDDCLACSERCSKGASYIEQYLLYKDSGKAFIGKGVPCRR